MISIKHKCKNPVSVYSRSGFTLMGIMIVCILLVGMIISFIQVFNASFSLI